MVIHYELKLGAEAALSYVNVIVQHLTQSCRKYINQYSPASLCSNHRSIRTLPASNKLTSYRVVFWSFHITQIHGFIIVSTTLGTSNPDFRFKGNRALIGWLCKTHGA